MLILFFAFLMLIIILILPIKMKIYNNDQYIIVDVANIINFKINLISALDNLKRKKREDKKNSARFFKKIEIKQINIKLEGLNFDYQLNGAYFGILYAVFGFVNSLCSYKNISFYYDLKYQGDRMVEFDGIIRTKLIYVIGAFANI